MLVFSQNAGKVKVVNTRLGVTPFNVAIQGTPIKNGANLAFGSVITQVRLAEKVNAEFSLTVGKNVHVHIFGDDVSKIVVAGVAFQGNCRNRINGLKRIQEIYNACKASVKRRVMINIAGITRPGFIVGMEVNVLDAANNMAQWTLDITSVGSQQ